MIDYTLRKIFITSQSAKKREADIYQPLAFIASAKHSLYQFLNAYRLLNI